MTDANEKTSLGGFEGRLLGALTEVDRQRAQTVQARPTRPIRRRPVVLAAAAATVVAVGGATAAVAGLSEQASFAPAAQSVAAGDTMTVKGTGCLAGSEVRFTTDDGRELGRVAADAEGSFVSSFVLPDTLAIGALSIAASCPDGSPPGLVQRVVVQVIEPEKLAATLAVAGSAEPGGVVVVKGAGCRPGTGVTVAVGSVPALGGAIAGSDGAYVTTLLVPSTLPTGTHLLTAECTGTDGSPLRLTVELLLE
jgi:hypothetical protein